MFFILNTVSILKQLDYEHFDFLLFHKRDDLEPQTCL